MIQFGKNLRARAQELELTDAEVARRSGLNERRYGFYVTGEREPDLATLMRIASVLQSSIDDLLSSTPGRKQKVTREDALISAAKELDPPYLNLLVKTAQTFVQHQRTSKTAKLSTSKK